MKKELLLGVSLVLLVSCGGGGGGGDNYGESSGGGYSSGGANVGGGSSGGGLIQPPDIFPDFGTYITVQSVNISKTQLVGLDQFTISWSGVNTDAERYLVGLSLDSYGLASFMCPSEHCTKESGSITCRVIDQDGRYYLECPNYNLYVPQYFGAGSVRTLEVEFCILGQDGSSICDRKVFIVSLEAG